MPVDATRLISALSCLHREGRVSAKPMAEVNKSRFQHSLGKPAPSRNESRHT